MEHFHGHILNEEGLGLDPKESSGLDVDDFNMMAIPSSANFRELESQGRQVSPKSHINSCLQRSAFGGHLYSAARLLG